MVRKVADYMRTHHMVQAGDHVSVGVSGGADSVCLFLMLNELRDLMGFSMSVIHIEHGIRGEESLFDMQFVKELSDRYGIPCVCRSYPVTELAEKWGLSVEEAARDVRYEAFLKEERRLASEVFLQGGTVKTAVAHHADDNAETILFHLCRGSGIDGLCGIRPVRGSIIRPLLCVTRKEIEQFLKEADQAYRTDVTNEDVVYSRNRIRKNIIPEFSLINEKSVRHMNQLAEEAAELSEYLCRETDKILKNCMKTEDDGEVRFALLEFQRYPAVLKKRLMLELIRRACGRKRDITREHTEAMLRLALGQTGKRISLPYGIIAEKAYDSLLLFKGRGQDGDLAVMQEILPKEVLNRTVCPMGMVQCRIFTALKKDTEIPKNLYTKWFDYGKIKNRLYLRTRKPGDYFVLDGQGHRQKLKDYLINEKVPKKERGQILLLADGSHILWAIGYRISEYYKVTEQTECVLEVQYVEEKYE